MSKEEIMTALKALAERLGRTPLLYEFRKAVPGCEREMTRLFGNYTALVRESGLRLPGNAKRPIEELFKAWAATVRAIGRTPNVYEFERHSGINSRTLRGRWGRWANVRREMIRYAEEAGRWTEWPDVLEILREEQERAAADGPLHTPVAARRHIVEAVAPTSRVYGEPVWSAAMCHAPTNEEGVLFAFGMLAAELGYTIMRVQTAFPDCEAMRKMENGRWQFLRIELEFESRNFQDHGHDPAGCDMIVCWVHNWKECPLPVLELSKVIGRKHSAISDQQSAFSQ